MQTTNCREKYRENCKLCSSTNVLFNFFLNSSLFLCETTKTTTWCRPAGSHQKHHTNTPQNVMDWTEVSWAAELSLLDTTRYYNLAGWRQILPMEIRIACGILNPPANITNLVHLHLYIFKRSLSVSDRIDTKKCSARFDSPLWLRWCNTF